MRVAVIDLGTNTSNLVIAGLEGQKLNILYQGKEYVRLGDQRITENIISDAALKRAIGVIKRQTAIARQWNTEKIRIIATSAVRHAANRQQFIDAIREVSGIEPEVIDGEREATLIYYGVKLALGSLQEPSAILDIGGGSNEIIICENGTVNWKGSFPAGMSRIINKFPISDPIDHTEIAQLEKHFELVHSEALELCNQFGVKTLIGCSGAFNTLADVIDQVNPEENFRTAKQIELHEFEKVYNRIVPSTHDERKTMQGMDPMRTDLIVPAMILSRTFLEKTSINKIVQTGYALREGVLYEMLNS
jgi:exopolyphosphatase / guanosine-5'-triphosphate,3'-diphosphate pyrophosphatase